MNTVATTNVQVVPAEQGRYEVLYLVPDTSRDDGWVIARVPVIAWLIKLLFGADPSMEADCDVCQAEPIALEPRYVFGARFAVADTLKGQAYSLDISGTIEEVEADLLEYANKDQR